MEKAGRGKPDAYVKGPEDYKRLLAREDLDAVIIATPWDWHTPMAVEAMKAGKYVGVEVPAAITLEECWALVNHVRGDGQALHDARKLELPAGQPRRPEHDPEGAPGRDRPLPLRSLPRLRGPLVLRLRREHAMGGEFLVRRNADQYPTHSLGPVLSWMNINCGDVFRSLTSTATRSSGINEYFTRKFGPDHTGAKRKYAQGDIVTTVVKTHRGSTIVINYDMQLPARTTTAG